MKQCETCIYGAYKEFLTRCAANECGYHWREFLRTLPLIGRHIEEYKCKAYKDDDAL